MKKIFNNYNLYAGRIISASKSSYKERYPDNEVYFNSNIFILGEGKVWWGDLDVTLDRESLECIARDLGKDLFVLREMDGRFESEILKDSEIISRSVCKISK